MKKIMIKLAKIILGAVLLTLLFVLARLGWAHVTVARATAAPASNAPVVIGTTASLTILPLYEEAAVDGTYESGHGVSYLVRAGEKTILMDLGNNPDRRDRAPVLSNLEHLDILPDTVDLLLISHDHPDHVGGLQRSAEQFVSAGGQSVLNVEAAYLPVAMEIDAPQAEVAETAQMIAPGVATLGRMPFVQPFPFWLWQPLNYEQALAVNVSGKGIVLITGCGHPSLERFVARAEALFAEPVVGIVGGLHYEGLSAAELAPHVQFMDERHPQLVALSPHDNGPEAMNAFRDAFPDAYQTLRVGTAIEFGSPPSG